MLGQLRMGDVNLACTCGLSGSLETAISIRAAPRLTAGELALPLADALAEPIHVPDPEMIVLSGGLAPGIPGSLHQSRSRPGSSGPQMESTLDSNRAFEPRTLAGVRGAAAIALNGLN